MITSRELVRSGPDEKGIVSVNPTYTVTVVYGSVIFNPIVTLQYCTVSLIVSSKVTDR